MLKVAKILTIFSISIFSISVLSDDYKDSLGVIDYEDKGGGNLYVYNPDEAPALSTMTYLVDSNIIDDDLLKIFKNYSDDIGDSHGSTFLTTNQRKLNFISGYGKVKHVTTFTSQSSCDFFDRGGAYVIFELKKYNECFYFDITKSFNIVSALTSLKRSIDKYANLPTENKVNIVHQEIEKLFKNKNTQTLNELKKFATYIIKESKTT